MLATVCALTATGISLALAAPSVTQPTITSHPANPTAQTTASFSFSDKQAGVTFQCSLDGAAFGACASPKTYSALGEGSHTFRVEARDKSGNTSEPASFTWTVDRTPPTITINFPANGAYINAAGWSAGCSAGPGVCGTASDPSGVNAVIVSIKQNASGNYWNGSAYSSSSELYNNATISTTATGANWRYSLPLPSPDGTYTLHLRATDSLGNQTSTGSPAASVFTIDTVPPLAPSITAKPSNPTNQTTASFSFTDTEPGVSYLCKLDGGAYKACSSPTSSNGLANGTHTFSVEAKDLAGNTSSPTSYSWVINTKPPPAPRLTQHPTDPTSSSSATFAFTDSQAGVGFECQLDSSAGAPCTSPTSYSALSVGEHNFYVRAIDSAGNHSDFVRFEWDITQQTSQPFTIGGNAPNLLYPGATAVAIPVKLTNPNNVAIFVTSLTVTLQSTGLPVGCATSNFQIAQSNISATQTVQVPANGSVTLPAQGATAPTVQMLDTHVNQDACGNATVSFAYAGSAHS